MRRSFWRFRAAADSKEAGELLLYGPIDTEAWWGDEVTPKQFKADLDALGEIKELRLFINSLGGDMFAGQAIYSMLQRHPARKVVYIDGIAASAASLIAMAGDVIRMPGNAMMVIHNPWTFAAGDANHLRKVADDLDKARQGMLAVYEARTSLQRAEIAALLDAETWLTAEEAVEKGFADEMEGAKRVAASLDPGGRLVVNGLRFDLNRFKNVPKGAFSRAVMAGVVPADVSRDTAPEDEPWESPDLSDFTERAWEDLSEAEKRRIAGHYAWASEMPPEAFGSLKLPHHRASDGRVVWAGVASSAARLDQTEIPDDDRDRVRSHLASHYRQFEKDPPWEDKGRSQNAIPENKGRRTAPLSLYERMVKTHERSVQE